jgi:hypothetical protein
MVIYGLLFHGSQVFLWLYFQEDFRNFWSECPWEEDLGYAEAVCRQAGVELRVVHLTDEYWGRVVSHCVSEIQAGRTPNPDILCNSRVKFGAFYDRIDFAEFDRVASGHYARLERGPEGTRLALCADEVIPRNLEVSFGLALSTRVCRLHNLGSAGILSASTKGRSNCRRVFMGIISGYFENLLKYTEVGGWRFRSPELDTDGSPE